MQTQEKKFEIVVCGGGLAGLCTAIAAARNGAKTALVHERPVLGGNSSSEVRVTVHGAACMNPYAREAGILSEMLIEERARNHEEINENGWTNNVWDLVQYDWVQKTRGLELFLNTTVTGVQMSGEKNIAAVEAQVLSAEVRLVLQAGIVIDCTGDGLVADMAGCEWKMGTEARSEYGEIHAPEKASGDVMGSSIMIKARDMGRPVPFVPPEWAVKHDNPDYFYKGGRNPSDVRSGWWWVEIGMPWHTIHQNEDIRHELTRHVLGVWDWIKNKDPKLKEKASHYALDWIGQVPGKRESRRIIGQYFMTENDIQESKVFHDEVAYGGWRVDLHTPGGLLANESEKLAAKPNDQSEYGITNMVSPYGIPLRILIARDVHNLMMAGRNVSVTHAALGSIRVMATTALMGQGAGTAAAITLKNNVPLKKAPDLVIEQIQQTLLRDGCFLPNVKNQDQEDLARQAQVSASSRALLQGASPDEVWADGGLDTIEYSRDWRNAPTRLEKKLALMIPFGGKKGLDSISICLDNDSSGEETVQFELYHIEHIWEKRVEPGTPLARGSAQVIPGKGSWVKWNVDFNQSQDLSNGCYLRLDVLPNKNLTWLPAGAFRSGVIGLGQRNPRQMIQHKLGHTFSFRTEPALDCYQPGNVISGVTRPHRTSNLWKSEPGTGFPQWLELAWQQPREISQVELVFPGHMLREYHNYPPFFRDPQCAREYGVEIFINGKWKEVLHIKDNYQRHRRHTLSGKVKTSRLRLVIHSTWGDPSAGLYEIRCYG